MKRKLFLTLIVITLLFPVFFAFRSQSIFYWLTGPDYRIKESATLDNEAPLANTAGLISLDYIQEDLSRLPFILNLQGRHLYGGREFTLAFYPGGAIITNNQQKVGVMTSAGDIIIPFDYDRIVYSDETFMATRASMPTIYFNQLGQPLFQTSQAVQTPFSGGLAFLSNGVHNKSGSLIFNPEAPILSGFHDELGYATTGSEVIIYQADGVVRTRLPFSNIYDLIEGYALVGSDSERLLVDFSGQTIMSFQASSPGEFVARTIDSKRLSDSTFDKIVLLPNNRIALRSRLTYQYYDYSGQPIFNPDLALAELFQDGYSVSSSGNQVRLYEESGHLVKTIDGVYVPGSLSEGTLVVSRPDLNGRDSQFLYSVTGRQLTYRPMSQIMPRNQGISVVFDPEKGIGYLKNEPATQWVFVPSKLVLGAKYAFPIGLSLMALVFLFIRRYKL